MDVDRTVAGDGKQRRRQEKPVRHDDDRVGLDGTKLIDHCAFAQVLRLPHVQLALERQVLDRSWGRPQAPAGRTVGLSEHQGNVVPGVQQPDQGALRESGSPRED